MKRLALLTTTAVLALFLSACGENAGSKTTTTTTQPSDTQTDTQTQTSPDNSGAASDTTKTGQ